MLFPEEKNTRFLFRRVRFDDDLKQLKNLNSKLAQRCASSSARLNATSFFKPSPASGKQFVTFKMNYSKNAESHKKFLKTYLTQENKDEVKVKPVVFGRSENDSVETYEQRMTSNHFKFMLSPESPKVPMKEFTKAFMEKVSRELGVEFDWVASVHTDTAHPHAHILINGKDRKGNLLSKPFPRDFIKRRAHEIASDITTCMIGQRTREQKIEAYQRSFVSTRWTKHDERIKEVLSLTNDNVIRNPPEVMHRRLQHLVEIKVASFSNGEFILEKDWDKTLRNVGRYNSYMKARDELKWASPQDLELWQGEKTQIRGIVRKIYTLNDEFENDNAIVIEDEKTKRAYFVPLYKPVSTKNEGKICTIMMRQNSKGRLSPTIWYDKENNTKVNKPNTHTQNL